MNIYERIKELYIAIENLSFTKKYLFGCLSELEALGRTNSQEARQIKKNIETVDHNIKMVNKKIEELENELIEEELDIEFNNELIGNYTLHTY